MVEHMSCHHPRETKERVVVGINLTPLGFWVFAHAVNLTWPIAGVPSPTNGVLGYSHEHVRGL